MSSKHFDKTKQILFHRILKMGLGVGGDGEVVG